MSQWLPIVASVVLAVIPVVIWLRIIARQEEEKGLYIKTFLVGTFSVVPPFILIFLFDYFPQLNIYSIIDRTIEEVAFAILLTNIVVGIVEEIAKNLIVRVIDKRHPEHIQTISSALKLSICAGLGFSFAENIFYFYNIWTSEYGLAVLFTTFIFRSLFTMCGHMVFSGIFGYYFGIGKFAADITEQARWEGAKLWLSRLVSRLTGKLTFQIVREQKNLQGLFLAMSMHALFNASLDLQHKLISIGIVMTGALYIAYLLQTKSGHMLFSVIKRRKSSMAAPDEDVVIELLGMWLKKGKLDEVISICDRLLARDPDNNVVKLFRAKAMDNQDIKRFYGALKNLFEKEKATAAVATVPGGPGLNVENEKVVLEVMDMWFKEGKYKQVLDVANRLLSRNPNSQGAQILIQKAVDKEKLKSVFESLTRLFNG